MKKVGFIDQDTKLVPEPLFKTEYEYEQNSKDKRGVLKLRQEIWRQDRKDRRAHMELIALANGEINTLHGIIAGRKGISFREAFQIAGTQNYSNILTKRLKSAELRISNSNIQISKLGKRIEMFEVEFLSL